MDGRYLKPVLYSTLFFFGAIGVVYLVKRQFADHSWRRIRIQDQANMLRPVPHIRGEGVIYDRNGVMLAWNARFI